MKMIKRFLVAILLVAYVIVFGDIIPKENCVEAAVSKSLFEDVLHMKAIDNWKTGAFNSKNGEYEESEECIVYENVVGLNPGENYVAHISNPCFRISLRLFDQEMQMVRSVTLENWDSVAIDDSERMARIMVYCERKEVAPSGFAVYETLFKNGFEAYLSLKKGNEGSSSAMKFVRKLGAGWNLGNSLCCADDSAYKAKSVEQYEKLWGNPVTTKKNIKALKKAGIKTVRIPITYRNHLNKNYKIDKKWMARVKQVVDYVIENDMYCIINIHHENWLKADESGSDEMNHELQVVWKQIAKFFSDYGNQLIFEGFNEVINSKGQWDSADAVSYAVVNRYNQTFVDTVRTSGGKNKKRYLIVNTYAAKATADGFRGFVLPKDIYSNRLLIGVHIYDSIDDALKKIEYANKYIVKQGVPVVIGEWGTTNTGIYTTAVRIEYAEQFVGKATEYGMNCVWWDDGGIFSDSSKVYNFALLNRKTNKWYFKEIIDRIVSKSL